MDVQSLSFDELNRLSIRTGCETELNRRADTELTRRGYVFRPDMQAWEVAKAREVQASDSVSVVSDGGRIKADRDTLRAALQERVATWRANARYLRTKAFEKALASERALLEGAADTQEFCANELEGTLLQSISESETP